MKSVRTVAAAATLAIAVVQVTLAGCDGTGQPGDDAGTAPGAWSGR